MKIFKLIIVLVLASCILSACTKHESVITQTGYPSGEIGQPQIMYNGEIYYYFATGFDKPLPEGYELVGSIEIVDNLDEPSEDFEGARVEVGQEVYACEEKKDVFIKYATGYARFSINRSSKTNKELLEEYYEDNVTSGNASVMLVDLTHDGIEEMILVNTGEKTRQELMKGAGGQGEISVVAVWGSSAICIYSDTFLCEKGMADCGYYLYEKDGQNYILKFSQEGAYVEYSMFYFDEEFEEREVACEAQEYSKAAFALVKAGDSQMSRSPLGDRYIFAGNDFKPIKSEQELFNEYYQENVGDGNASTIFADLTHDGTEELIILNLGTQTRQEFEECHGDGNLQIVDIIHNRAVMIYEDSFSIGTHQGNRWYYLYEKEGKEYIYKYIVGIYGGVGNVFRELFSFDEYGQQEWAVLDEMFYNSGPSATDVAAEQEKLKQFLKESLVYEDMAMPLVKVGHRMYAEELIDGAEYYDAYVHEGNELCKQYSE